MSRVSKSLVIVIERSLICCWTVGQCACWFSLTDNTCLQLWRPQLPPVCHRTTEASPPPGSTSRSISWGRSSPPRRPDGRSSRCPLLVLPLKTMMRRVRCLIVLAFRLDVTHLGVVSGSVRGNTCFLQHFHED